MTVSDPFLRRGASPLSFYSLSSMYQVLVLASYSLTLAVLYNSACIIFFPRTNYNLRIYLSPRVLSVVPALAPIQHVRECDVHEPLRKLRDHRTFVQSIPDLRPHASWLLPSWWSLFNKLRQATSRRRSVVTCLGLLADCSLDAVTFRYLAGSAC